MSNPLPDARVDAIGGYPTLEGLWARREPTYPGATGFQSARAAFLALLMKCRPARVWAPWYLCDSMREPLVQAGTAMLTYSIDSRWRPEGVSLRPGDWLLHVNYFGLCDAVQRELLDAHRPEQLVFDNAQAFYSAVPGALATIRSPRKFFGIPDGGLLEAPSITVDAVPADEDSPARFAHLVKRAQVGAEAGYADYARAEQSLVWQPPRAMSRLTEQLLATVDHAAVKLRRIGNFEALAGLLAPFNRLSLKREAGEVPLCYPFLPTRSGLREVLHAQRVYVPRYWPDRLQADAAGSAFERELVDELLPLPIDQRYVPGQLREAVVEPILQWLAGAAAPAAPPRRATP